VLAALFVAFKFLDKALVNAALGVYFFGVGAVCVGGAVAPLVEAVGWRGRTPATLHLPLLGDTSAVDALATALGAVPAGVWWATRHWLANNALGVALCVQAAASVSLGRFRTAAVLLAGLFVYDIVMVFFTPMMVTVATSVDGPIKLLFPRGGEDGAERPSLLGLGDIALPGLFVAMALRFDAHASRVPLPADGRWPAAPFRKPLYHATLGAYAAGLGLTLVVMHASGAAQPALLYLVPAVLLAAAAAATATGQWAALLAYDEEPEDAKKEEADAKPKAE
jgi:minor histocompatibility antigen H13